MVSVVLLTTEEVLQRNKFWSCLDDIWATEELEPFEEVNRADLFMKPLSRDFYYAKFPDIPRSESEEENSLSLSGFKSKHQEWKTKISVRRHTEQRRHSTQCYLSYSGSRLSGSGSLRKNIRRVTSMVDNFTKATPRNSTNNCELTLNNDERVLNFLNRLQKSVPPPPIELLQHSKNISVGSIEVPKQFKDLNDVELPEYDDFVSNKKQKAGNQDNGLPTTSTMKKVKRKVSFKLDKPDVEFITNESWYDSIYGISDLMTSANETNMYQKVDSAENEFNNSDENASSWSEILMECDVNQENILKSTDSLTSADLLISYSHGNTKMEQFDTELSDDEEALYARFAIYKIHQTLKIESNQMIDSSSMKDFNESDCDLNDDKRKSPSFYGAVYSLVPNTFLSEL